MHQMSVEGCLWFVLILGYESQDMTPIIPIAFLCVFCHLSEDKHFNLYFGNWKKELSFQKQNNSSYKKSKMLFTFNCNP